jgi:hypothetical protein
MGNGTGKAITTDVLEDVIGTARDRTVFHGDVAVTTDEPAIFRQMVPICEIKNFGYKVKTGVANPGCHIEDDLYGLLRIETKFDSRRHRCCGSCDL